MIGGVPCRGSRGAAKLKRKAVFPVIVAMETRQLPSLTLASPAFKLAIARDLKRIWADVLQEPLPTDLQRLIKRLEQVTRPTEGQESLQS
jgi:hypothetical protein